MNKHGKHIKVIGEAQSKLLNSSDRIKNFLTDLISALEMRMLGDVHIYEVELEIEKMQSKVFEDEGGITGVAVLSTSHCSIHTWPLRNHFVLDVYSCRDFNEGAVRDLIKRYFYCYKSQVTDISHSLIWENENEQEEHHQKNQLSFGFVEELQY